ncbi:MAG: signal peptidase I [Ruminococcaceae bacterium]|nr:signal peptidase I [Oscillospiraceae bacterium]
MIEEKQTLTTEEQENPPTRPPMSKRIISAVFDYVELFAWSVLAVLVVFTFGIRLCRVDGQSMENTLQNDERLLLYSAAYTPEQGDIIVFHLSGDRASLQKTFVKRVIAVGGQTVEIDLNKKTVTVDGKLYDDPHAVLKNLSDQEVDYYYSSLFSYGLDSNTGIFKTTVPEGKVFAMGDNRNNSKDSRNVEIGFVDERCILGKVILRVYPFTVFS